MRVAGRASGTAPRSNAARAMGWTFPRNVVRLPSSTICVMRAGTRGACDVVAVCACASGLCPAATIRGSVNANNKAPRIAHRLRPTLFFVMNPPATWSLLLSCPASRPDPLARKAHTQQINFTREWLSTVCINDAKFSRRHGVAWEFSRAEAGYKSGIANFFLSIPPDFVHGSRGPGLGGERSSASSVIRIPGMDRAILRPPIPSVAGTWMPLSRDLAAGANQTRGDKESFAHLRRCRGLLARPARQRRPGAVGSLSRGRV